jgi:hypothetical protein
MINDRRCDIDNILSVENQVAAGSKKLGGSRLHHVMSTCNKGDATTILLPRPKQTQRVDLLVLKLQVLY